MQYVKNLFQDLCHIFFPHVCIGCGTDIISRSTTICARCLHTLPLTNFNAYTNNPTEKSFWGRLPLLHATSLCYFSKGSLTRHLLHQLKYNGNKEVGYFLGRLMGTSLLESTRFNNIQALIPLPLHPSKEKKRGYNQAKLLCEGMAELMQLPILNNAIKRTSFTETQTLKNRHERWQNMEDRFQLLEGADIAEKHILLVDDVITTGATLEACGNELLKGNGTKLSIATLAIAMD